MSDPDRMTTALCGRQRHIGLFSATGIGVGAIVGGAILALTGTALQTAGPAAPLAFAINGLIALVTALNFAESARPLRAPPGPSWPCRAGASPAPKVSSSRSAAAAELLILGLNQHDEQRPVFGDLVRSLLADLPCAIMLVGQRA